MGEAKPTWTKEVLSDITDGTSARRSITDQDAGAPDSSRVRAAQEGTQIEATGAELRTLMSRVDSGDSRGRGARS